MISASVGCVVLPASLVVVSIVCMMGAAPLEISEYRRVERWPSCGSGQAGQHWTTYRDALQEVQRPPDGRPYGVFYRRAVCLAGESSPAVLLHHAALVIHDGVPVATIKGEINQGEIDAAILKQRVGFVEQLAQGVSGIGAGRGDCLRVFLLGCLGVGIGALDDGAHGV